MYGYISKCAFVGIDIDGRFVNGNFESVFVDFSRSPDFDICFLEFFTVEDVSPLGVSPRSGQRVVLADYRRLFLDQCLKPQPFSLGAEPNRSQNFSGPGRLGQARSEPKLISGRTDFGQKLSEQS